MFNIYRLNFSKVQQEPSGWRVYTVDSAVISVYHGKTEQMQNKQKSSSSTLYALDVFPLFW